MASDSTAVKAILLNVGCGATFHPDWINIDIEASPPHVRGCDIRRGIPFPDAYFDACYHSHVLEHLHPVEAAEFLKECLRVLKPGAILRVVVPDLEGIAREYLVRLEEVRRGGGFEPYDWMVLELLDQLVREKSGGYMGPFLLNAGPETREFLRSRLGTQVEGFWDPPAPSASRERLRLPNWRTLPHHFGRARHLVANRLMRLLFGRDYQRAFQEALFRNQGEVHKWMYDSFSLGKLLQSTGFRDPRVCGPRESSIPDFQRFQLDEIGGKTRKRESLFMECRKP